MTILEILGQNMFSPPTLLVFSVFSAAALRCDVGIQNMKEILPFPGSDPVCRTKQYQSINQ